MKNIYALLFFFCFVFISSNNQCSAQNARARNHVSFDEDWKFHFGNASDPSKDFNYSVANIFSKTGKAEGTGSTVTTRGIYSADTVNAYVPDEDITAPPWANTAERWWTLAAARKWWMGGFVWTGFDHRGEPTPYTWPNINSGNL